MRHNRLYLVRHGENTANLTKEFSCRRVDYSLTAKGILQARQVAAHFAGQRIDAIYASPLKRAVETADIIAGALRLPVTVLENFREVNVGALEGKPSDAEHWKVYFQVFEDWFAGEGTTAFPEGENYHTLWERMRSGLRQVLAHRNGENIIIVGHAGIFTATLKDLCRDIDVAWLRQQPNHNGSITEVTVKTGDSTLEAELVQWASTAHLHGEAAEVVPALPDMTETR